MTSSRERRFEDKKTILTCSSLFFFPSFEKEGRDRRRRRLNFHVFILVSLAFSSRENNEYRIERIKLKKKIKNPSFLFSSIFSFSGFFEHRFLPPFPFVFSFRRRHPSGTDESEKEREREKIIVESESIKKGVTSWPPLLFSPSFLPNNREGVTVAEHVAIVNVAKCSG